jgi:hypothetical protein
MAKDLNPNRRRHIREKSVIDHLARKLHEPKPSGEKKEDTHLSPTTSTGLPVEDQVRKEWDPRNGGLPTF